MFAPQMKVAFGGVDPVSQPPCQPDRSNEQTGTSNALALPGPKGSKSTQKGVTENALFIGPTLHPKDKLDGGGGSKSGGSLASGTLGLEWRRSKLRCVTGRQRVSVVFSLLLAARVGFDRGVSVSDPAVPDADSVSLRDGGVSDICGSHASLLLFVFSGGLRRKRVVSSRVGRRPSLMVPWCGAPRHRLCPFVTSRRLRFSESGLVPQSGKVLDLRSFLFLLVRRSLLQRRCARPISLRRWAKRMYTVSGLGNGGSDLRTSPERRHRRL
ncbi:hypothetical protein DY000_02026704 [Brassica cretica]|uniref:Uncharacterized protein n=1 Tax=Brassica cretica TaxID=69181 RepID=A0ABQ7EHZ8_BRACR|nr:hypothetical protein DY000_02026704 [Brassica cretica]